MDSLTRRRGARGWIALVVVGLVGGVLSGMFGVGGGIVMIPLLMMLAGFDQRTASATSLVAIVPTAIAGAATYAAGGRIAVVAGLLLAAGGILGSYLGALLLKRLPIVWLRWLFVALLLGVAVRMALVAAPRIGAAVEIDGLIGAGLVGIGLLVGVVSGLFGIGGGVIAVPALIALMGMDDLTAKGTSLLMMIPTATSGTVANLRNRVVDIRAGIVVGVAAVAASFGGVALAFLIPPQIGGIVFAALLVLSAAQLAWRAIKAQRSR